MSNSPAHVPNARKGRLPASVIAGYWAEVTAFHHGVEQELKGWHLGGYAAPTPQRALARLRLRVRRMAGHMVQTDATNSCLDWLRDTTTMRQALGSLADGEMYVHLVQEDGTTTYEFALRPVYLPTESNLPEHKTACDVIPLQERRSA